MFKKQTFVLMLKFVTFLLIPTWYTNFLFIHTNYIRLNSSTCFERIPPIIRRSTTQIVHMWPLVSSLSAGDCLVQPLRQDWLVEFLSGCTRQPYADSDDTRGYICTIRVVDLLMMSGLRSKHVEEFNLTLRRPMSYIYGAPILDVSRSHTMTQHSR